MIKKVLIALFLPLLCVLFTYHFQTKKITENEIKSKLYLEARSDLKKLQQHLQFTQSNLKSLAKLRIFAVALEYDTYEGLLNFFNSYVETDPNCLGAAFVNRDRELVIHNSYDNHGNFLDLGKGAWRSYVESISKSTVPKAFDVLEHKGKKLFLYQEAILNDEGETAGWLVALYSPQIIRDITASFEEKSKVADLPPAKYEVSIKPQDTHVWKSFSKNFIATENIFAGNECEQLNSSSPGNLQICINYDSSAIAEYVFFRQFSYALPLILVLLLSLFVVFRMIREPLTVLNLLIKKLSEMAEGNYQQILYIGSNDNQKYIETINSALNKISAAREIEMENNKNKVIADLASQVSHDIRSPLLALEVATKNISQISEDNRILIREAIKRIKDISNHLLQKRSLLKTRTMLDEPDEPSTHLVYSLVESILSEKNTQIRDKMNIELVSNINSESYGLFANVVERDFKRIISNLINNSLESLINDTGLIGVDLEENSNEVVIRITDNGRGMTEEQLSQIGEEGLSFGKVNGSGIGVHHAKQCLETWNGRIEYQSKKNLGTTVSIYLPKVQSPAWFVDELIIDKDVIVLDDDQSIHRVWKGRMESAGIGNSDFRLIHFSSSHDIMNWYKQNSEYDFLLLCDYELLNEKLTGLDVIEKLNIAHKSILVTSRFEEAHIKNKCSQLGVKLIPKTMASLVPIFIETNKELNTSLDVWTYPDLVDTKM